MTTPATERQMSYLRSLVAAKGEDIHDYLIAHGISEASGPHGNRLARKPSKTEASLLIAELAPERSGGNSYRGRGRRRSVSTACTHEDYPCCGCDR